MNNKTATQYVNRLPNMPRPADQLALDTFIGKKLQSARKAAKLRQKDLGDFLGMDRSIIYAYESARCHMPINTLFKLAAFLDKPTIYFFPPLDDAKAGCLKGPCT
ncbi:MAG: helix-turn-helix transcriptional regulator [Nitrospinaceae bacterium]